MAPRLSVFATVALAVGCTLPTGGLSSPGTDAGGPVDDGGRMDAGRGDAGDRDAGPLIRADAGPQADGDTCPSGWVDVDMDPTNGCECELSADLVEYCNGRDDDCDPTTFDGQDEMLLNQPCDGDDDDRCEDGVWVCNVDALVCTDDGASTPEVCGGGDEDCDSLTDEGGAIDAITFYDDDDGDTWGDDSETLTACSMPVGYAARGGDCDDTTPMISPGAMEGCDGVDEDCSGLIDDNGGCDPCTVVYDATDRPYLYCDSNPQGWAGARTFCTSSGYHLVIVDTMAENSWVASQATPDRRYWIGLRQPPSSWGWVNGTPLGGWDAWASGEPNNGGCCGTPDEDCAELNSSSASWNDFDCDENRRFICELAP